jgi:hypothetical protein
MIRSAALVRFGAITSGCGPSANIALPGRATNAAAQPARSAPSTSQEAANLIREHHEAEERRDVADAVQLANEADRGRHGR